MHVIRSVMTSPPGRKELKTPKRSILIIATGWPKKSRNCRATTQLSGLLWLTFLLRSLMRCRSRGWRIGTVGRHVVIRPLGHDSAALWLAPCHPQQYSVDKNRADRIFHFLSLLRLDTFKHPLKILTVLNMQTIKLQTLFYLSHRLILIGCPY